MRAVVVALCLAVAGCRCMSECHRFTIVGNASGAAIVMDSMTGDLSLRSIPTPPMAAESQEVTR